jgi:hypothetical protein
MGKNILDELLHYGAHPPAGDVLTQWPEQPPQSPRTEAPDPRPHDVDHTQQSVAHPPDLLGHLVLVHGPDVLFDDAPLHLDEGAIRTSGLGHSFLEIEHNCVKLTYFK